MYIFICSLLETKSLTTTWFLQKHFNWGVIKFLNLSILHTRVYPLKPEWKQLIQKTKYLGLIRKTSRGVFTKDGSYAPAMKETTCNTRDPGSIPGSGRSPGGGNGSPLQHYFLENPMYRGAWWAIVRGAAKSQTQFSNWVVHHPAPS